MGQGSLNDAADKQRLPSWNDISRGKHPLSIYALADCVVTKILVKEGQVVKKGQTVMWFEEKINEVQVSDAELSDSTSSIKRKVTHTKKRQTYVSARIDYVVAKIYVTENQELKKWQQLFHFDFLESEPNPLTLPDDMEEAVLGCPYSDVAPYVTRDVVSDVDMMNQGSLSDAVDKQQQKPLFNWNDISHGNDLFSVYALADCVVTKILVKEGQEVKEGEILMYLEAMEIKEEDSKAISPSSTQSDSKDEMATSEVFSQPPRISESAKSKEEDYKAISPSSTQSDSKDDMATSEVFSQPPRISESAKSKVIHTGKRQHAVTARDSYVVSKLNVSEKQEVKKYKPLFHYELTEMNPYLALPIGFDVETILAIPLSDPIWTAGICDANFNAK